jgi:Mrp family chromosome partitioning ATPase
MVEWGHLDYMIVDLPPGTGDIALSLVQNRSADRSRGGLDAVRRFSARCA